MMVPSAMVSQISDRFGTGGGRCCFQAHQKCTISHGRSKVHPITSMKVPDLRGVIWWAARDPNSPTAAICGRGRGSPAIDHSLAVGSHRARGARVTRDHRIKSPLEIQWSRYFSGPPWPDPSPSEKGRIEATEPIAATSSGPMNPTSGIPKYHIAALRRMACTR